MDLDLDRCPVGLAGPDAGMEEFLGEDAFVSLGTRSTNRTKDTSVTP